jgi:hypothetical protein
MRKKMVISEEQLKRIMEFKVNELNVIDVAKQLKHLPCSGDSIKNLVINKLRELGYQDVKISFIGYEDETNNLMYTIYTEGPMFVIKAQSSNTDKPCLEINYVQAYDKIQS